MAKNKSTLKKIKQKILKSPPMSYLISLVACLYILFVYYTTKWKIIGIENLKEVQNKDQAFIGLCWHGRMAVFPPLWSKYKNNQKLFALVSPHHDGRIIANILNFFGVKTIDGSSNDNAQNAALNIARTLTDNNPVVMIPDGPRGPRQTLNISPIYFASKTQKPIVMATYSFTKAKIISKSWDSMMLPKPFSKGIFIISEPIHIPSHLNNDDMEKYRKMVENKLNDLQNQADDYTNTTRVSQGTYVKEKRKK